MNCSIVYCLEGRWAFAGWARSGIASAQNAARGIAILRVEESLIVCSFESGGSRSFRGARSIRRFHHRVDSRAGNEAALDGLAGRVHADAVDEGLPPDPAAPVASPRAGEPG